MKLAPNTEARRRTWSFVAGMSFLAKFALLTPSAINPLLTALIAACIFGPGVLSMYKGGKDDE